MTNRLELSPGIDGLFRATFPMLEDSRPAGGFSPCRPACDEGDNEDIEAAARILGVSEGRLRAALLKKA